MSDFSKIDFIYLSAKEMINNYNKNLNKFSLLINKVKTEIINGVYTDDFIIDLGGLINKKKTLDYLAVNAKESINSFVDKQIVYLSDVGHFYEVFKNTNPLIAVIYYNQMTASLKIEGDFDDYFNDFRIKYTESLNQLSDDLQEKDDKESRLVNDIISVFKLALDKDISLNVKNLRLLPLFLKK